VSTSPLRTTERRDSELAEGSKAGGAEGGGVKAGRVFLTPLVFLDRTHSGRPVNRLYKRLFVKLT
jgi:hypothetical protein